MNRQEAFESDVVLEGTQTRAQNKMSNDGFESDVVLEGTQTLMCGRIRDG